MSNEMTIQERITREFEYLYNTGKCYHAYKTLGAHLTEDGVWFSVWAPDVKSVRVVGDFNDWGFGDGSALGLEPEDFYLELVGDSGIYAGFIPGLKEGVIYKYDIECASGKHLLKADPFAFAAELRPATASKVANLGYKWKDSKWMSTRKQKSDINAPMNIYEAHLGAWHQHVEKPEEDDRFYSYEEIAKEMVPYVKNMGYTHVELMPVMEHPFDASWGYQVTGYYAATARYGSPVGLKKLIDAFHQAGIGVILDWVPGHFCPDEQGLANFNGTMMYECEIHPDWGTYKFDYSRGGVRSFLLSNAMFWLEQFHADGIRVDGVSSMLYLNFGVTDPNNMKFNKYGDEGNLEAMDFLREFNHMVGEYYPDAITIAEESTAWPLVTAPPEVNGLGFNYKWNMGWMNDTLEYMSLDFPYRDGSHNRMTFAMSYAYAENYILPLSHDEVVHGKCSIIGRMPGDVWRQFAGVRMLAGYQMTHPGKKLNFMGYEIAQFIEWREYEQLEWFLLEYENHAAHKQYINDLNVFYKKNEALWSQDTKMDGFMWIDADNKDQSIYSFVRFGEKGQQLLVVVNADVATYDDYRLGVPTEGSYKEVFNSDAEKYGGSGKVNPRAVRTNKEGSHGQPTSVDITVPPLGIAIFECKKAPAKKKTTAKKTATKKASAKKTTTAKTAAAKAKTKVTTAKKVAATKTAKTSAKKTTTKKAATTKATKAAATTKKPATAKASAAKSTAKKATATKTAVAKKTVARKAAATKTTKVAAKTSATKKAAAAKKSAAKTAAKVTVPKKKA